MELLLYVRMSGTVVGTGDTSVNTSDKSPCFLESYIPDMQVINRIKRSCIR